MKRIKYTWNHKKMFLKVEKHLLGYNTLRGYLHDTDKLIAYFFLPYKLTHNIHRKISRHHKRAKNEKDYIQMIIDWECARFTKEDKPLNAYETLYAYYPQLENKILYLLEKFEINKTKDKYNLFEI